MITFPQQFYDEIAAYRLDAIGVRPTLEEHLGKPNFGYALEAWTIGAMSRLLGLQSEAREYFWYASMLYWPFDRNEPPTAVTADLLALLICRAAMCAHLAGHDDRAAVLREWALQKYDAIPPSLYEPWKPGAVYETDNYGQIMLFSAYSGALSGRWDEVDWQCSEAITSYERAAQRRTLIHKEHLALARALRHLRRQHAKPSPQQRKEAEEALSQVAKAGKDVVAKARACSYVWDLQEAFPGLIGEILAAPPHRG